jgi:hypothetical protein
VRTRSGERSGGRYRVGDFLKNVNGHVSKVRMLMQTVENWTACIYTRTTGIHCSLSIDNSWCTSLMVHVACGVCPLRCTSLMVHATYGACHFDYFMVHLICYSTRSDNDPGRGLDGGNTAEYAHATAFCCTNIFYRRSHAPKAPVPPWSGSALHCIWNDIALLAPRQ